MIPPDYQQPLRPQFHFSARTGWLNDPNGLIHFQGQWHLFFQHNPLGNNWGNMTWGHAVSPDLLHWRQVDHALHPDDMGTMFSGTALVDHRNVLKLQQGDTPALVLFYTAAGGTSDASKGKTFTQCLAYSTDGGNTFHKHPANPIVPTLGIDDRDPRVFWHAPSQRYVMVLYVGRAHPTQRDAQGKPLIVHCMVFLTSDDLLHWQQQSFIPGMYECPDLFEMTIEGTHEKKWVLWVADSRYYVGSFDGRQFIPETERIPHDFGVNYYAAQWFANAPDGRSISLGWMRSGQFPDMPFNHQMSFPTELRLRKDGLGLRLYREPVREIANLYESTRSFAAAEIKSELVIIPHSETPGHDVTLTLKLTPGSVVDLNICGKRFTLDALQRHLHHGERTQPVLLRDDELVLRLLIDRASVELFADAGRTVGSWCMIPAADEPTLALHLCHGQAQLLSGQIHRLRSAWT